MLTRFVLVLIQSGIQRNGGSVSGLVNMSAVLLKQIRPSHTQEGAIRTSVLAPPRLGVNLRLKQPASPLLYGECSMCALVVVTISLNVEVVLGLPGTARCLF